MIYFKKVIIPEYTSVQLESALRKVSSKLTSSLDAVSSSTDIGTDKLFLGYEGKSGVRFTRIKYFVEKYLPSLIIKLNPGDYEAEYQLRLSLISSVIFIAISLFTLTLITALFNSDNGLENVIPVFIVPIIYGAILFVEFKLTTAKVNKALRLFSEDARSINQPNQ